MDLSKLDLAKGYESGIKDAKKHIDLINKIITTTAETSKGIPKIGVRVNPNRSDALWLEIPEKEAGDMIEKYLQRKVEELQTREQMLADLLK